MSMHEIEELVEKSIRRLAGAGISDTLLRNFCHNLFSFQSRFDTGFTHLRVFNILLKCGYLYLFGLDAHPSYAAQKQAFDALVKDNGLFVYEDVNAGYNRGRGKLSCYWLETRYLDDDDYDKTEPLNKLCCVAGSDVWRYFVARGDISGERAIPPDVMSSPVLATALAEWAITAGDASLLIDWYMASTLFFYEVENEPEAFQKMCDVFLSEKCFAVMLSHHRSQQLFTEKDDDDTDDVRLSNWFRSFRDWAALQGSDTSGFANPLENALVEKGAWIALRNTFDVESDLMVCLFYETLRSIIAEKFGDGGKEACNTLLDAMQQYVSLNTVFCEEDAKLQIIGIHHLYVAMVHHHMGDKQQVSERLWKLQGLFPKTVTEEMLAPFVLPR